MNNNHHIQTLDNGFIRIHDRRSGLSSLWHQDGTHRSGDLRNLPTSTRRQAFGAK